jgi:hypothetical protein
MVVPHVFDMTVLGSHVQSCFKIANSVNKRLQAGNGAFFTDYEFYASKYIPLKEKFSRYSLHVLPKALYGSGRWYFSNALYDRLRAWENNFLRIIVFVPRKPDELYVPYLRRRTNYALGVYVRNGYTSAVCKVLDKIWTMATAVPLPSTHRCCLISKLLPAIVDWRDTLFWVHLRETAEALHMTSASGWRHPRRGRRSACWDTILLACFGDTWKSEAHAQGARSEERRSNFCTLALRSIKVDSRKYRPALVLAEHVGSSPSAVRTTEPFNNQDWDVPSDACGVSNLVMIEICGDNKAVIELFNASTKIKDKATELKIAPHLNQLHFMYKHGYFTT